ncbi:MAG: Ig-like domain-containing protein, partial [Gemmatimonadales bacterium]
MFSPRAAAILVLGSYLAAPPPALQVLRSSPRGEASPVAAVTVTFDRPVAGSLDRTVDARTIFAIQPAVAGKVEWRDPVTIRFTPSETYTPGTRYSVTIQANFQAMDGSRLAEPYGFSFQVSGPRALTGLPANGEEHPRFLTPESRFEVVFSAPLDLSRAGPLAYLDFDQLCKAPGIIRLTPTAQRAIGDQDPWQYQQAGGYQRDRAADRLRRVVSFVPERKLPLDCAGTLVVPSVIDAEGTSPFLRWGFRTYGGFGMVRAACNGTPFCPAGGIRVDFGTPVLGAELMRHLKIFPQTDYTISDTTEVAAQWYLEATLRPNTGYAVVADTALRDVFGQRLQGNPAAGFTTTGYAPLVEHEYGRLTIERAAFHTLPVKYVNVDTLDVLIAPVPDTLEAKILQYSRWGGGENEALKSIVAGSPHLRIGVAGERDRVKIFGVKIPVLNAMRSRSSTLQVVRVTGPQPYLGSRDVQPYAIVQVTDLGVHARIGTDEGVVWVTGASDGLARSGAVATLYDDRGRIRATATTNADGIARLSGFKADTNTGEDDEARSYSGFEGYVAVSLGTDRALTAISQYDPDLSPWLFNARSAWGEGRFPAAGAVFTERGIYRPGEPLYAKAIVRRGPLGALQVPVLGDSLRWIFTDRENGTLRDTTVLLSPFGTAAQTFQLPAGLALGQYAVKIQRRRQGEWHALAETSYRVAEYRPPEFLVEATTADTGARFPGDSFGVTIQARYLFGAPMGRAALSWTARQSSRYLWELGIPGTDGYFLGENGWWWEDSDQNLPQVQLTGSGTDTLDAGGGSELRIPFGTPSRGRPATATVEATVTDVNRQTVSATASVIVHPASFYLGAKPLGKSYFWTAGTPQSIAVIAVKPNGERVTGVSVAGTIVRREWHQVHRDRAGFSEIVGEWVADTVARCALTSGAEPVACDFTPPTGGSYIVSLSSTDRAGRKVSTSFYRWATGQGWVPWNDESRFKMDVIPDRTRYTVGDTATMLFASPFTEAEAWITVEREGLIEQRRLRITSGSTAVKFPITEAYPPNAFVSILVARGRSAPPGRLDDPGRPTIRVGYAELRVTPEPKRLAVALEPLMKEYRPGDTARVHIRVRDARGAGQRSEVTLWAVDQGVLALTGYKTPDPIDLLYRPRGLGLRLASNLTTVAPQVPEGEKGRSPGGGGGLGESDVLRSRFKTTAFFLGSVITDSAGSAVAKAKLPDNLTTFRVMAVAVTAGDRYGKGESPMLVTQPLLARPALPRFLREGDRFTAGVVVNERAGGTPKVLVRAEVQGAGLAGESSRTVTLEAGRGREVRFDFRGTPGDSATFRFKVSGGKDADAVQNRLAIRPAYHPRAYTYAGVLRDTATAEFTLPAGIDPDRSTIQLSLGTSPLSVIRGIQYALYVYPYGCSEQVSSSAWPIVALYRAQKTLSGKPLISGNPKREIEKAVAILSQRQRVDGGIGYWGSSDWTTPWLSAYAGLTLLEARAAGIAVSDSVLARLGVYLAGSLHSPQLVRAPVLGWYQELRTRLSDQVAAADYLSRLDRPDLAAENELLRLVPQMGWEDRIRLAEVLARRGAIKAARGLLTPAWNAVRVEGRRAVVPDSVWPAYHYFYSRVRPTARLLTATLAVDSANALIGPLVETLVQQGRAGVWEYWNTQDYAAIVSALATFDRRWKTAAAREFKVMSAGRAILASGPGTAGRDSSTALSELLADGPGGTRLLRLNLAASGEGPPVYFYLTVHEVPLTRPLNPDQEGLQVERWYERYDDDAPVVSVTEGDLVRVRLRITVPSDRQFLVLDDALPAGLEAVDLSLRTAGGLPGPGAGQAANQYLAAESEGEEGEEGGESDEASWYFGSWDSGWWSPFDHKEIRDDRVVYFATVLWKGTYTATY